MDSAAKWTRTLAIALLCAVAFVPGVLHARICLVAIGAIERSNCCSIQKSCCSQESNDAPVFEGGEQDCHCCLDFDLDTGQKTLPASLPSTGAPPLAAPAHFSESLTAILPPPASERAQRSLARAGPRPRMAAPLPLRI